MIGMNFGGIVFLCVVKFESSIVIGKMPKNCWEDELMYYTKEDYIYGLLS